MAEIIYSDTVLASDATGTYQYGHIELAANSIYDPEYSTSLNITEERNGQPRYHDQLAALYGRYKVLGSEAKITFVNTSDVANEQLRCFLYWDNPGTGDDPPNTSDYIDEHPFLNDKNVRTIGPADGGKNQCVLRSKWNSRS